MVPPSRTALQDGVEKPTLRVVAEDGLIGALGGQSASASIISPIALAFRVEGPRTSKVVERRRFSEGVASRWGTRLKPYGLTSVIAQRLRNSKMLKRPDQLVDGGMVKFSLSIS
jgi:hypothetical protein